MTVALSFAKLAVRPYFISGNKKAEDAPVRGSATMASLKALLLKASKVGLVVLSSSSWVRGVSAQCEFDSSEQRAYPEVP